VIDYRMIPPIGQNDAATAWAACLCWWLRASGQGRPCWTQDEIIEKYQMLTYLQGSFDPVAFRHVFGKDKQLNLSSMIVATAKYTQADLPIGDLPTIIAYNHPQIGMHFNVIFAQRNRNLIAMEPYHPYPGKNGRRGGVFISRGLDFFISCSLYIMLASPILLSPKRRDPRENPKNNRSRIIL